MATEKTCKNRELLMVKKGSEGAGGEESVDLPTIRFSTRCYVDSMNNLNARKPAVEVLTSPPSISTLCIHHKSGLQGSDGASGDFLKCLQHLQLQLAFLVLSQSSSLHLSSTFFTGPGKRLAESIAK